MSVAMVVATREAVAFCRRREAFWLLCGMGLMCVAPFLMVLTALAQDPKALNFSPSGNDWPALEPAGISEVLGSFLRLQEVCVLALLGHFLAKRALESEIAGGSWTLLRLTSTPVRSTLLGKAVGIGFVLACVHGFVSSLLLLTTPFIRRTHAEVWAGIIGGFLVAVSLIPEGFAQASLLRGVPLRSLLLRLVTAARLVVLFALLQILLPTGEPAAERMSLRHAEQWIDALSSGAGPAGLPLDPLLSWAVAVAWMGLSGFFVWRFVVGAWRS